MRSILIGVCAPQSCDEKDVRVVINMINILAIINPNQTNSLKVLEVRTPHNTYFFWSSKDQTFSILFGVTGLVMTLLTVGTTYEVVRGKRYEKVHQSRIPFTENHLGGHTRKIGIEHWLSCSPKDTIRRGDAMGNSQ